MGIGELRRSVLAFFFALLPFVLQGAAQFRSGVLYFAVDGMAFMPFGKVLGDR